MTQGYDIGILMPVITDMERFSTRYQGLSEQLDELNVSHFFANGHRAYQDGTFNDVFDVSGQEVAEQGVTPVVRDLTMPSEDQPLYGDSLIRVVHDPETNAWIADKSNIYKALPDLHPRTVVVTPDTLVNGLDIVPGDEVVVKPVTGMQSEGVHILPKSRAARLSLEPGRYLLQEALDTSIGIPSLGIEGVHNARLISIHGVVVGGIARVRRPGSDERLLRNDIYGSYIASDDLPTSMSKIADRIHGEPATLPGQGRNVVAIDIMRGVDADGNEVVKLCELNRRPMRVSRYNLRQKDNLDEAAIIRLASEWDQAEAVMLKGMVA
ncbi:MAG TPA: hypothetical protein VMB52_03050 [Verrucomicrobiae bacterium]|nr:hypothetical protein [Verrucomicrobiae bacterium]